MSSSIYFQAAGVLEKLEKRQGTIKSLVYNNDSGIDKKRLYALTCQTLKYKSVLDSLITASHICKYEKKLNQYLLYPALYDHLIGPGLQCQGKLKDTILRHKSRLNAELVKLKLQKGVKNVDDLLSESLRSPIVLPKYLRINLLKCTVNEAYSYLQSKNFQEVPPTEKLSTKMYCLDPDVPNLLTFANSTDFHEDQYYLAGKFILQDKASCFPALILNPPSGSVCMDACAAPGNKTSHLSAILQNSGTVYAFDSDLTRFKLLKRQLEKAGARNVYPICQDFLTVKHSDPLFEKVEYIMVDPSCSGSGIVRRLDHLMEADREESRFSEIESGKQTKKIKKEKQNNGEKGRNQNTLNQKDPNILSKADRLISLSAFQRNILAHALKFPNVKKVVYSTCSINNEENEEVVKDVYSQVKNSFSLTDIWSEKWHQRGVVLDQFPEGVRCLRTSPIENKCIGFFVALFERK